MLPLVVCLVATDLGTAWHTLTETGMYRPRGISTTSLSTTLMHFIRASCCFCGPVTVRARVSLIKGALRRGICPSSLAFGRTYSASDCPWSTGF